MSVAVAVWVVVGEGRAVFVSGLGDGVDVALGWGVLLALIESAAAVVAGKGVLVASDLVGDARRAVLVGSSVELATTMVPTVGVTETEPERF